MNIIGAAIAMIAALLLARMGNQTGMRQPIYLAIACVVLAIILIGLTVRDDA